MITHGESSPRTLRYSAWLHMRARCNNPLNPRYKDYRGRGITIDPLWSSFVQFAADMPPHPGKGWSLERVKNHLGYSKGNCVWARPPTQARNRRNTKLTAQIVTDIRRLHKPGINGKQPGNSTLLAARFGVTRATVTTIIRGDIWA